MILVIVVVLLVVFGMAVLFAAWRRRDSRRAVGRLSRETKKKDRSQAANKSAATQSTLASQSAAPSSAPETLSAREVESEAVATWRGTQQPVVLETEALPEEWTPPDPDAVGVTRRQFLNRSIFGFMALGLSGFGAAVLGFLWPPFVTGFGAVINVGHIDDVMSRIKEGNGFYKVPEGKMWITEYPATSIEKARSIYGPDELAGMERGVVALYWKCPHLGCTVPECVSSQWFECPCHGSQYNRVGEKRGGPAPRGMDRFKVSVNDKGEVLVDTGTIIQGPAIGVNTTGQEAEGPNCIGQATH